MLLKKYEKDPFAEDTLNAADSLTTLGESRQLKWAKLLEETDMTRNRS